MMFKRSGIGRLDVFAVLRPITTTRASFVFPIKNCLSPWLLQLKDEWLEFFAINPSALNAAIIKVVIEILPFFGCVWYSTTIYASTQKSYHSRLRRTPADR